ncbi:MAG: thiopurine S-methyltransferase, partial [Chthoniobacterales bacterium]
PRVGNETYEVGDLFNLSPENRGVYDWVFEHTCFCAIDPARRNDYVKAVASALKAEGHLLAIFFLNPDHDEDGPPFGVTLSELDEFFGPFFSLEREWRPTRCFPGRENREMVRLLKKR